jgi:hypothetical protein
MPAATIDAFFTIGRIKWGGLAGGGDFLYGASNQTVA